MKTLTLRVEGMTCAACAAHVEKAARSVTGVVRAHANLRGGRIDIEYDDDSAVQDAAGTEARSAPLKAAIEAAGYVVTGRSHAAGNAGTLIALGIGLALSALYLAANAAGLFNSLPKVDASIGYGMLFVVGILTSVHCIAMCGGISLSQSVKIRSVAGSPAAAPIRESAQNRLLPGLLYNGGRVLSYVIVGGIVGALGSAFSFSPAIKGGIAAAAGLFMLALGLRMLGLIPSFHKARHATEKGDPSVAPSFLDTIRRGAANKGPFIVGLLNGLMPCGPLQTMQLYALGTGSFIAGASSMFFFALGTVPLMLSFGFIATLIPRRALPFMVKASAVLVMVLGLVTITRGASLNGIAVSGAALPYVAMGGGARLAAETPATPAPAAKKKYKGIVATLEKGAQTVTTEFRGGRYVPFTVQAGMPLRWIIRVREDDLFGCNNPVTVPSYGIEKELVPGDNLIEFTPKKTGTIGYTCWMGMISSRITVVQDLAGGK